MRLESAGRPIVGSNVADEQVVHSAKVRQAHTPSPAARQAPGLSSLSMHRFVDTG